MLICVGLLFLILTCGNASYVTNNGEVFKTHVDNAYMQWPSYKNNAKLHILKREAILLTQNNPEEENKKLLVVNSESESKPPVGLSEGGGVNVNPPTNSSLSESPKSQEPTQLLKTSNVTDIKDQNGSVPLNSPKITDTKNITKAAINDTKPLQNITIAATNATTTDSDNLLPINNPGVVKRGSIVFGGFAILAAAYFIFYRKKNNKYDTNSTHNANDANQFRYGVLQSDDRRDNLELARIPLTMESDDDDEDEDLEIFDLEQKKKSLSYVNLQVNDEDIVLNGSKDESKNNLLLDIEDGPSDTLINWSSNGNKSIL